jgi:hypothetical protein
MMIGEWEPIRGFAERGPAEAFSAHLEFEHVPTRIEAKALENSIETRFWVLVPRSLAHRARWVTPESVLSDAELNFLATGKLPGQE